MQMNASCLIKMPQRRGEGCKNISLRGVDAKPAQISHIG
jgi:hypothetical protein